VRPVPKRAFGFRYIELLGQNICRKVELSRPALEWLRKKEKKILIDILRVVQKTNLFISLEWLTIIQNHQNKHNSSSLKLIYSNVYVVVKTSFDSNIIIIKIVHNRSFKCTDGLN